MRRRYVLSPAERAELSRLWHAGAPVEAIADRVGICRILVYREAREAGLPPRHHPRWTAEEDATLIRMAGSNASAAIAREIKGRSRSAISKRAAALGVQIHVDRRYFTPAEDAIIRANYGVAPVRSWMDRLPGRTRDRIIARARLLGLKSALAFPRYPLPPARPFRSPQIDNLHLRSPP